MGPTDTKQSLASSSPAQIVGPLLTQHAAKLVLYARQLCNEPEDAVQQAFIDLATLSQLPDEPIAWLYRCVRNKALTTRRSKSRRIKHEQAAAQQRSTWFRESPEDRLDATDVAEQLQFLESTEREVVVAHLWGGLTFRQVGTLLGVSGSTAFRQYENALRALRERMSQECTTNN